MKKLLILILTTLCLAFSFFSCGSGNTIQATIDVASSKNFRCDVEASTLSLSESFTLGEKDAKYLFENCFSNKEKAQRLKANQVAVGSEFIKIYFVGDCVDNAPVKNDKADYGGFVIFSNDIVRFEYDTASEYYLFESGFYNFINTYMILFADR